MMFSLPRAPLGALAIAAIVAASAGHAQAQGTDAQREACTPDAFRLCQSTIPDIDKTTACMKAHFAQLSPKCKVAFNAATGGPRSASTASAPSAALPQPAAATTDFGLTVPGLEGYAAQIRNYCRQGLIDEFTCRNTLATLNSAQ